MLTIQQQTMIDSFFSHFGLTKNEKDIYLLLLESGNSIASLISKRLAIKRVTVYPALETLKKKGLVSSIQKNKVTYFGAAPPEEIVRLCEEKTTRLKKVEEEARKILPRLQQVENKKEKPVFEVKGRIKYYQGLEAVKKLIDETLEEGEKEQLCFGLNQYHVNHLRDEWRKYTKKRTAVGMNVRSIQPDLKAAKEYKKRDKDELRVTQLVPHKRFPAKCELNIIGDMIALFSAHGDEPTGMKIYNKDMAEILKSLFELAWERAQEYEKGE